MSDGATLPSTRRWISLPVRKTKLKQPTCCKFRKRLRLTRRNECSFLTQARTRSTCLTLLARNIHFCKPTIACSHPWRIAADQQGTLYVTDKSSRSVLVFDPRGKFSRELMKTHGSESYFEEPRGIAIHRPSGRLYVCDGPRSMVVILDKRGKVLGHIGKRGGGRGPGEFSNPVQVAVTGDEVVVLDAGNSRFQVFDLQGHFRRETPAVDADARSGLAADQAGNVYITDPSVSQIEVFGPDGHPLYRFGQTGQEAGQFNGPEGLWIEAGCLIVADTGNRRVQEFRINGQTGSACQ